MSEDWKTRRCSTTPDRCTAIGPDGEKAPHFENPEAGQRWVEDFYAEEVGNFSTLSKDGGRSEPLYWS